MNKFTKRSLSKTLKLLLGSVPDWVKKSGEINVTKAAKDMGLNQPTLKRWVDGTSLDPDHENASKICKRFRISINQLMGEKPIPNIDASDGVREEHGDYGLPPKVARIVNDLINRDEAFQDAFVQQYNAALKIYAEAAAKVHGEVAGSFAAPNPPKRGRPGTKLLPPK